jgi:hypothetical protein
MNETGIYNERQELQEMLDELDPESRTLFVEIALGRDAIEFFQSDIGRYMVGCAQQEYALASAKLKGVAWWRKRRIQQLQNEIWRAEQFMVWLRDLIIRGKASEVTLEDREET